MVAVGDPIRRTGPCKRLRQSVSTSQSRFSKSTALTPKAGWDYGIGDLSLLVGQKLQLVPVFENLDIVDDVDRGRGADQCANDKNDVTKAAKHDSAHRERAEHIYPAHGVLAAQQRR